MLDLSNKKISQSLSEFQQKYSFILISIEKEHNKQKEILKQARRDWRNISADFGQYKSEQRMLTFEANSKFKQIEKISDEAKSNLQFISNFDREVKKLHLLYTESQESFNKKILEAETKLSLYEDKFKETKIAIDKTNRQTKTLFILVILSLLISISVIVYGEL